MLLRVYSLINGWHILNVSVKSKLLIVLLSSIVSLFSFCFEDLSSGDRSVLKSPRIIVLWSI